jgi:hypothetical protein
MTKERDPKAYTRLIEDYCRTLGAGDVHVETNASVLEFEDVTIILRHDETFGRVSMTALVDVLTPETLRRIAPDLLQINGALTCSGGHAFGTENESGEVQLHGSLPLESLDAEALDAALATLRAKCQAARGLLTALQEGSEQIRKFVESMAAHDPSMVMLRV